jgi:hypothetical protein
MEVSIAHTRARRDSQRRGNGQPRRVCEDNKGPDMLETLLFLTDVIERIEEHHRKKIVRLRHRSIVAQAS